MEQVNAQKIPASVQKQFECVRSLVRMVLDGWAPSMLITGQSGIGKSYLVQEELDKKGLVKDVNYKWVSGYSTASGLYRELYHNRDQMLIVDDCDSVFKDPNSLNVLKAALDSKPVRTISWLSKRGINDDVPTSFEYRGQIIFISNIYIEYLDSAIVSRCLHTSLRLDRQQLFEYLESILPNIETYADLEKKKEVLAYMNSIMGQHKSCNIRTLMHAIRIRCGVTGPTDWREVIKQLIK